MLPYTHYQGPETRSEPPGSRWRRAGITTGLPIARGNPYATRGWVPNRMPELQLGTAGVLNNNIHLVNAAPGVECHHPNPRDCPHHGNPHHPDHPGIPIVIAGQMGHPGPGEALVGGQQLVRGQGGNNRYLPPAIYNSTEALDGRDPYYLPPPARQGSGRRYGRSSARNHDSSEDDWDDMVSSDDDRVERLPPWMYRPGRGAGRRGRGRPRSRESIPPMNDWNNLDLYVRPRRGSPDSNYGRSSSYVRERPSDTNWWCAKLP